MTTMTIRRSTLRRLRYRPMKNERIEKVERFESERNGNENENARTIVDGRRRRRVGGEIDRLSIAMRRHVAADDVSTTHYCIANCA